MDKLSARLEVKADTHRKLNKEVAVTKQRLEKAAAAASSSSRQVRFRVRLIMDRVTSFL